MSSCGSATLRCWTPNGNPAERGYWGCARRLLDAGRSAPGPRRREDGLSCTPRRRGSCAGSVAQPGWTTSWSDSASPRPTGCSPANSPSARPLRATIHHYAGARLSRTAASRRASTREHPGASRDEIWSWSRRPGRLDALFSRGRAGGPYPRSRDEIVLPHKLPVPTSTSTRLANADAEATPVGRSPRTQLSRDGWRGGRWASTWGLMTRLAAC
jgi:hypothetical protein